jgi:hypothetical protein
MPEYTLTELRTGRAVAKQMLDRELDYHARRLIREAHDNFDREINRILRNMYPEQPQENNVP